MRFVRIDKYISSDHHSYVKKLRLGTSGAIMNLRVSFEVDCAERAPSFVIPYLYSELPPLNDNPMSEYTNVLES